MHFRYDQLYTYTWPSCLQECMDTNTRECRREGDNDFDRYAVAVLRRGVVVRHLPQLPLTSTLWHCWTFLLTSLSSFADRRVQSFSSGSISLFSTNISGYTVCTVQISFTTTSASNFVPVYDTTMYMNYTVHVLFLQCT